MYNLRWKKLIKILPYLITIKGEDFNNELNSSSSVFDTAFSSSQLPDDFDSLPIINDNNVQNYTLQSIADNNNDIAQETVEETVQVNTDETFGIEPNDDDEDLPQQANDILSWNRVTLDGGEITDKNSIEFIRLCLCSISQVLYPSENVRLTKNSISMLYRILYRFGFVHNFKFDGKILNKKLKKKVLPKDILATTTLNLGLFYTCLNKITVAINKFYWIRYFALPERIAETPLEFRMCYNQFLFEKIKRFNIAINDDDWQHVGQLIGSIDIDSNLKAGNNSWYTSHKTMTTYNLLWENLFFIGFQRILLQNIPSKQKALSLEHMLKMFSELVATETFKIRKLLPLFIVSVLTFGMAHNDIESISQILQIKMDVKFNEPDLNFNIRAYQFYNQFKEINEDPDTNLNNVVLNDLFQTMQDFFDSATERKMKKLLFLFEPFLMLSQYVEGEPRALETLIRYCIETPALLPYTAKIFTRCGLAKFVGRLITECIEHDPSSTFLHRFPLIIHYIGQRSIQAIAKRSLKYEDAEKHVRMSFNYLDYGRNRTNGDAWLFFKENLEYLNPFPDWVYQEWNERAGWWPKFHNIPLDNNEIERAHVFRMFRRQSKKRKF